MESESQENEVPHRRKEELREPWEALRQTEKDANAQGANVLVEISQLPRLRSAKSWRVISVPESSPPIVAEYYDRHRHC